MIEGKSDERTTRERGGRERGKDRGRGEGDKKCERERETEGETDEQANTKSNESRSSTEGDVAPVNEPWQPIARLFCLAAGKKRRFAVDRSHRFQ